MAQGDRVGRNRDHPAGVLGHGGQLPDGGQRPRHPLHGQPAGDEGGKGARHRRHPDTGRGDEEGDGRHPLHDVPNPQNLIINVTFLQFSFKKYAANIKIADISYFIPLYYYEGKWQLPRTSDIVNDIYYLFNKNQLHYIGVCDNIY